jgi:hypothetical protein
LNSEWKPDAACLPPKSCAHSLLEIHILSDSEKVHGGGWGREERERARRSEAQRQDGGGGEREREKCERRCAVGCWSIF